MGVGAKRPPLFYMFIRAAPKWRFILDCQEDAARGGVHPLFILRGANLAGRTAPYEAL